MIEQYKPLLPGVSEAQIATLCAAILVTKESAMAPQEGCEHLFKVRWKEGVSICLLCRSQVEGPNDFCISITGPNSKEQPL